MHWDLRPFTPDWLETGLTSQSRKERVRGLEATQPTNLMPLAA